MIDGRQNRKKNILYIIFQSSTTHRNLTLKTVLFRKGSEAKNVGNHWYNWKIATKCQCENLPT